MATLPALAELEDVLFRLEATMGASEAHGALCGMICVNGETDLSEWIDHALGDQPAGQQQLQQAVQLLSSVYQITIAQLNDGAAKFDLLLPDDEFELSERVAALAAWCQGYTYGLAAGGINENSELPDDTRELINDFIEISRAGHSEDTNGNDEEDEQAFMEISEYVRMGVLLINEELQPMQASRILQ